ncbi:MAG: hypothetical protein FJX67_00900 [Alphaproteobacteria bacterium]|nr:hypothetical protein [Alphaproteobacteria bacterium]
MTSGSGRAAGRTSRRARRRCIREPRAPRARALRPWTRRLRPFPSRCARPRALLGRGFDMTPRWKRKRPASGRRPRDNSQSWSLLHENRSPFNIDESDGVVATPTHQPTSCGEAQASGTSACSARLTARIVSPRSVSRTETPPHPRQ